MGATKKSIIISSILIIASVTIYFLSKNASQQRGLSNNNLPTLIASGFHGKVFNQNGIIENELISKKVTYFDNKKTFNLEKPHFIHYDYKNGDSQKDSSTEGAASEQQVWYLDSDKATIITNDVAHFYDNIVIYPLHKNNNIQKAEAPLRADYNFKTKKVTSDDVVTIYGQSWKTTGTEFTADLNANTITYKGKPNVTIYPSHK
ncbi:MAG: LPS export ABC transporter periplasmic protein LptC [Succinivibrio sp.]|nr:LPS export ABC transporter periplasmic protein LptC [Succinivibrio sp.]